MADGRDEWANRARRYLKAELKRAEVSYAELARRLKEHGLEETEASITAKLNRAKPKQHRLDHVRDDATLDAEPLTPEPLQSAQTKAAH